MCNPRKNAVAPAGVCQQLLSSRGNGTALPGDAVRRGHLSPNFLLYGEGPVRLESTLALNALSKCSSPEEQPLIEALLAMDHQVWASHSIYGHIYMVLAQHASP